jgi:HD superfamily phosphodiesterase
MNLYNTLFQYVLLTSQKYRIDESHAVKHSMDVFHYAHKILEKEVISHPLLKEQEKIIYCSAITHDMCDWKYRNESEAMEEIKRTLTNSGEVTPPETDTILKIISTMSYSKVKKQGFPELDPAHMLPYHIVREADLLSAYDFERCIIYQMYQKKTGYLDSLSVAEALFETRVLKYIDDGLFLTEYGKRKSVELHDKSVKYIARLKGRVFRGL